MEQGPNRLPLKLVQRIDALCLAFEKAWLAAEGPRLEEYLEQLPEAERPALLAELLPLEMELRLRGGDRTAPRDLFERFPGEQGKIETLWREIAESEARPAALTALSR